MRNKKLIFNFKNHFRVKTYLGNTKLATCIKIELDRPFSFANLYFLSKEGDIIATFSTKDKNTSKVFERCIALVNADGTIDVRDLCALFQG